MTEHLKVQAWDRLVQAHRRGVPVPLRFIRGMAQEARKGPLAPWVRSRVSRVSWRLQGDDAAHLLGVLRLPNVAEIRFTGIGDRGPTFRTVETFPQTRAQDWVLSGEGVDEDLFPL